jgi:hypothetical protein
MRKHIYLGVLMLVGMAACTSSPTAEDKIPPQTVSTPPAKNTADTAAIRQKIRTLESEIAELKTHFTYRQHNLPIPSYYHKNWWDRYTIRDNALLAGVDSAGIFFLIACYNCSTPLIPDEGGQQVPLPDCDSANSRLELRMKDTTIKLIPRPLLIEKLWPQRTPPIERDLWIGTGHYCTDYYPLPDNPDLIHLLADSTVGYFKFYRYCNGHGTGDIGQAGRRDRTGIRDCARLAELIQGLRELNEQVISLTPQ